MSLNVRRMLFCLLILYWTSEIFCIAPGNATPEWDGYVHEPGYCVMYDECGVNTENKKNLNCVYNDQAKLLTDAEGLELVNELCPYLYHGDKDTRTCCSTNQLRTMKSNFKLPYQYLSRCPSCYRNFVALFCEMTCSPNQSAFTNVQSSATGDLPGIRPYNDTVEYVKVLDYNVANQFANAMFNSCSHVNSPATNSPALKIMCGPYGDKCSPQNWITYMNDISNGQEPFQINVFFSDDPTKAMHYSADSCDQPSFLGESSCSCSDCPAACSGPHPTAPTPSKKKSESESQQRKKYFDEHFGPFYRTEELIIQAPFSKSSIYSPYTDSIDPKDVQYIPFGPVLQKDALKEILKLQDMVAAVTATYRNQTVKLSDICLKPLAPDNNNCIILSVLNYFQNNETRLDQEAWINDGFSLGADYHDHLVSCTSDPAAVDDVTHLHMSCLGTYGGPIFPWVALGGYDGKNYLNATAVVITFPVVNYYNDSEKLNMALAWESEFIKFMKEYKKNPDTNLSVNFSADRESGADVSAIIKL